MVKSNHLDELSVLVEQEKKTVTYRWLSRHFDIDVRAAKELLSEYKQNNKVHALYCVCGWLKGANSHSVYVVAEEELEDVRKEFKEITGEHVYSVEPTRLSDTTLIVATNLEAVNITSKPIQSYGAIVEDTLKKKSGRTEPTPAPVKKEENKLKPTTTSTSDLAQESKKADEEKAEQTKPSGDKPQQKPKGRSKKQDFFGKGAANSKQKPKEKKEEKKVELTKADEMSEDEQQIQSKSRRKRKKMIQDSDEDEDEENESEEELDRRMTASFRQAQANLESEEEKEEEKEEEHGEKDQDEPLEAEDSMEIEKEEVKEEMKEADAPQPKKGRGRRQVMKKKTYKDERGRLVTETAMEWESFSEDESSAPPTKPPSSTAKSQPAKHEGSEGRKKGTKPGQKSLLSYFGKKQ
ncbi:uncharacterized protein VTP21DRAFT_1411 [Calcarisporiella thermophila]|uniref:uncharacterized protein n=1 Tax=Calcarisporiella thermophila TaxID=911321 RepID=UPI0037424BDB